MKITKEIKDVIKLFNRVYENGAVCINGVIMSCDTISIDDEHVVIYKNGVVIGDILIVLIDTLTINGYNPYINNEILSYITLFTTLV